MNDSKNELVIEDKMFVRIKIISLWKSKIYFKTQKWEMKDRGSSTCCTIRNCANCAFLFWNLWYTVWIFDYL